MAQTASISKTSLRKQSFDFQPVLYSQYVIHAIHLSCNPSSDICLYGWTDGGENTQEDLGCWENACVTSHPPNALTFSVHLALEDSSAYPPHVTIPPTVLHCNTHTKHTLPYYIAIHICGCTYGHTYCTWATGQTRMLAGGTWSHVWEHMCIC